MPTLKRLCTAPGCGRTAVRASSYCAPHKAKSIERAKLQDKRRGSAWRRGYDEDWRRLRDQYIRARPNCEKCGAPAEEVDHITPIRRGGKRLDPRNLQSLCGACHRKKTAQER